MSSMKHVVTFATASLLTMTGVGVGAGGSDDRNQKRWGTEAMPSVGVCFFEDVNFRGRYFCVQENEDLRKMPKDMRDRVSSVRVIGHASVLVFKDEKFKGQSGRFLTDVPDLRRHGWNDQISSIRVTKETTAWDSGRFPGWGRESVPREGACFYRDVGFKGDYFCVPRGASYEMVPSGFNDKISSVRVIHSAGVMIFRDRDFDGQAARLTSNVADLRSGVWNDRISSIRVF